MTEEDLEELTPVPVIWLWDNILVPLQGDLTDGQAARLSQDVLSSVVKRPCAALIVDASGLWLVDSHLCSVLADLARSARLMGVRTILSGLRPEIALTLLAMDISLDEMETVLSLEQALEQLGIRHPSETGAQPIEGMHEAPDAPPGSLPQGPPS